MGSRRGGGLIFCTKGSTAALPVRLDGTSNMTIRQFFSIGRRTLIHASSTFGALQLASPFIIKARGETPVKMRMVDPTTGSLSALAASEVEGAKRP